MFCDKYSGTVRNGTWGCSEEWARGTWDNYHSNCFCAPNTNIQRILQQQWFKPTYASASHNCWDIHTLIRSLQHVNIDFCAFWDRSLYTSFLGLPWILRKAYVLELSCFLNWDRSGTTNFGTLKFHFAWTFMTSSGISKDNWSGLI